MTLSRLLAFLDTNILVYAFEPIASSKRARAQSLVNQALDVKDAVISFQIVQEFLNVAMRSSRIQWDNRKGNFIWRTC